MTDTASSQVLRSVRVLVTGRVQGVCYRAWTADNAKSLGLSGWVRNCRDGTVDAVFCGSAAAVDEMIIRCRRGPPAAKVEAVEVLGSASDAGPGFEIRRDG